MNHQEDGIQNEDKSISEESKRLLNELRRIPGTQIRLASSLYESLCKDGLTPKEARGMIEKEVQLSYRTLMRALPQEAKQRQDHPKSKRLTDVNLFQNQAKLADVVPVSIPPPEQRIIEPEAEQEAKELVHKTIRITMSPGQLSGLSKEMKAKLDANGWKTNYVIEYDYVDKALYVDVTESWETELMVND